MLEEQIVAGLLLLVIFIGVPLYMKFRLAEIQREEENEHPRV